MAPASVRNFLRRAHTHTDRRLAAYARYMFVRLYGELSRCGRHMANFQRRIQFERGEERNVRRLVKRIFKGPAGRPDSQLVIHTFTSQPAPAEHLGCRLWLSMA